MMWNNAHVGNKKSSREKSFTMFRRGWAWPDRKSQTRVLQYAAFPLLRVPLEEKSLVCLVLCNEVPWHLLFTSSGGKYCKHKGHASYYQLLYMACFLTLERSTEVLILSGPLPRLSGPLPRLRHIILSYSTQGEDKMDCGNNFPNLKPLPLLSLLFFFCI